MKSNISGIDVATNTRGHARELYQSGIRAVGLYLRLDRTSLGMSEDLLDNQVKRWSIYERGDPTHEAYFTRPQANRDANEAVGVAQRLGQPLESQIFFCVDFDATNVDLPAIDTYFIEAQRVTKACGFLCSCYGSGKVCSHLTSKGLAHSGYLAQSEGWAGYSAYKPYASVIQGPEKVLLGFDVDTDTVLDTEVLW